MPIYFLVEGKRTESIIYPNWLNFLLPNYRRVDSVNAAEEFCYFIISGDGYPNIKNRIYNSLEDIESNPVFTDFVVILDSDEVTVEDRRLEIEEEIARHKNNLQIFNLNTEVIVQHRCIETWLLGNRKIFKVNPSNKVLRDYIKYYDVADNDPEEMGSFKEKFTHSQFHYSYLKLMLMEKNIRYSKRNPKDTKEVLYLKEIISRSENEDDHLNAFQTMITTIKNLQNKEW